MDDDQKEYMLNTKLMRNDISYDITASDIGIDKIRLENYATWKTKGTLYTQRYDSKNQKWAANFMVPPMCAGAELESFAEFPDGNIYYVDPDEEEASIPISFGAKAINLSEYAKEEHVKEIKSEIYANDVLIDIVTNNESISVQKDILYLISNDDNNIEESITIDIMVKSYLLTKFTTDGALTDIKHYKLEIYFNKEKQISGDEIVDEILNNDDYVEPKTKNNYVREDVYAEFPEIPPPFVQSIEVGVISGGSDKKLSKAKSTGKEFVCAGQTITIKAVVVNAPARVTIEFEGDSSITNFDSTTKKFEWDEPRSRRLQTYLPALKDYQNMYSGFVKMKENKRIDENTIEYTYTYIIPYETKQTLNSWSTLRKNTKDAFDLDESKIFTRIRSPYQIVVKAKSDTGMDTARYNLDVFERWDTIYNRDISKYLVNDYGSIFGRQRGNS